MLPKRKQNWCNKFKIYNIVIKPASAEDFCLSTQMHANKIIIL